MKALYRQPPVQMGHPDSRSFGKPREPYHDPIDHFQDHWASMQYQRSLDIERRLEAVLRLVREECHSTPGMAKLLRVSVPTVSRDLTALRERGFNIRADHTPEGWRYRLDSAHSKNHAKEKGKSANALSRRSRGRRR